MSSYYDCALVFACHCVQSLLTLPANEEVTRIVMFLIEWFAGYSSLHNLETKLRSSSCTGQPRRPPWWSRSSQSTAWTGFLSDYYHHML